MLKVRNVSKSFGKIRALEAISFDVDKGEFVFICGPSGAGKTTLLRLILRDLLPDSGEIVLAGRDITTLAEREIPALRQQIGVVFQDFKVLKERTLRENVEVALAVIGLPQEEWKPRVDNVLKLAGLFDRQRLFPSQLSGGELQRVSLARALVVDPKIILADEPTGNLDWETADELMELFRKVSSEGKAVIMATHHELIVGKLGKRVIRLKKGKVLQADKPIKEKTTKKKEEDKAKKEKDSKNKPDKGKIKEGEL